MPVQRTLVAGLGNPGDKYLQTRHNAGFWMVDVLARAGHAPWKTQSKLHSEVCEVDLAGGQRLLLAKPQTFMNKSGIALRAIMDFYKIGLERVLVAHDELDLPPGRVRMKRGGGAGGHNGLKDIIRHCGTEFSRMRIGVGHPGRKEAVLGHVLSAAGSGEQAQLDEGCALAARAVEDWLSAGWDAAVQRLHSAC